MASPNLSSSSSSVGAEHAISLYHAAITAAVFLILYLAAAAVYSVKLHPLYGFPGPIYTSLSYFPYWFACITGQQVQWMHKLPSQYGSVARYGPNELSYVDQDFAARKVIHGHDKSNSELPKTREWFVTPFNG